MKVICFAPVLRQGSFNKKLIHLVYKHLLSEQKQNVELLEFNEFPMPMYDGDIETGKGIPDGVQRLAKKIIAADAIIISSPEYNWSIPGTLKNAIDWLSRIHPVPLERKQILLMGASEGNFATMRGQLAIRIPLQALKAFTYPDYFGLANCKTAFDEEGNLKDTKQRDYLFKVVGEFLKYVEAHETPFERLNEFMEEKKHQPQNPQQ